MRPKNWAFFTAIASCLALTCVFNLQGRATDPTPEIAWVDDLDQAKQLAKTHNKPLMIHFYGDHCPPCRMLEATAFRNRDLVLALNDNVIATKVNADKKRGVAQFYQVTRWPTDVYLHADGTIIERSVSNQDPQAYSRTVERVSQRHRDWALAQVASRESQERRDSSLASRETSKFRSKIFGRPSKVKTPVKISATDWNPRETTAVKRNSDTSPIQVLHVEQQFHADPSEADTSMLSQEVHSERQLDDPTYVPGLGGYCPVALQDYLKQGPDIQATGTPWVPGQEAYSVRHRGRIYRCASEESRQRLLRDPDAFAPIFSGFDLVEFARSGSLVSGKCELGFIEQNSGKVFLFSTRANYDEFLSNCERYSALGEPSQDRLAHGQSSTTLR